MSRLTRSEVIRCKKWLSNWRSPELISRYLDRIKVKMSHDTYGVPSALFNQPGVDFLLEMKVAADVCAARSCTRARLVSSDPPDFELKSSNSTERWELTELIEQGRRRGDEYLVAEHLASRHQSLVEDDPYEDWVHRVQQIPELLKAAVRRKVKKQYPSDVGLMIYVNIDGYGILRPETERAFKQLTAPAGKNFRRVAILWEGRLYDLWDQGRSVFRLSEI